MKKLFLCFCSMILFSIGANAAIDVSLCPKPPYPVSAGFGEILSNITGTNFILTKAAELVMEKQLKRELGANFNVELYSYGGKNLIDGKFKRLTASANNVNIEGLYITSIYSESMCDYNHFIKRNDEYFSAENFLSKFDVVITSADLQRTFSSSKYTKMLSSMEMSFNNFVLFKVFEPAAAIKDNRIVLSLKLISPLVHAGNVRSITMNMGLDVKDGQIVFSDVKMNEKNSNVNINAILPIVNKLNPFMYETTILKTKGSIVRVNDINIQNDTIHISGNVFIPKSY